MTADQINKLLEIYGNPERLFRQDQGDGGPWTFVGPAARIPSVPKQLVADTLGELLQMAQDLQP